MAPDVAATTRVLFEKLIGAQCNETFENYLIVVPSTTNLVAFFDDDEFGVLVFSEEVNCDAYSWQTINFPLVKIERFTHQKFQPRLLK